MFHMNFFEMSPDYHFTITFCLGPCDKAATPTTRHTWSQSYCLIGKGIGSRTICKGRSRGVVDVFIRHVVGSTGKVRAIIKGVRGGVKV